MRSSSISENISPTQWLREGQSAYKHKNYQEAAQAFQAAAAGFSNSENTLAAAEALNNCSVAWLQAGNPEAALEAVVGTDSIFAQAGDRRRQAMALGNLAAALEADDKYEEAASAYESSANLLKEIGESELRANVLRSLSAIQLRLGRQLEALATMQAGLDTVSHPSPKQRMVKKLLGMPFNIMNRP